MIILYEFYKSKDADPDELSEDELPAYKRPPPKLTEDDIRQAKNPEEVLKKAKKGQMMMLFVTISGSVISVDFENSSQ